MHYTQSIESDENLSPLWKDVFLFHWKEESQHAILDELEWRREDAQLDATERDRGGRRPDRRSWARSTAFCRCRPTADADYFIGVDAPRVLGAEQAQRSATTLL